MDEACTAAKVPIEQVANALDAAPAERTVKNWQIEPLTELIAHIKKTHHLYTRNEIKRLGLLFEKVYSVHGANHPELRLLRETFSGLTQELTVHMMKEEAVLFPYIERMEESLLARELTLRPPFGTVHNPVAMMTLEHERVQARLCAACVRRATGTRRRQTDASAIKPYIKHWRRLRPICTSTFISRTTSSFHGPSKWSRHGKGRAGPWAGPGPPRSGAFGQLRKAP